MNIKQLKFSGKAPVDEHCPNKAELQVTTAFGTTYSKTLNQSNINNNNNKFYIMQILETLASPKKYFVFFRWGRIGHKGSKKLVKYNNDLASSISDFEDKLHNKTVEGSYVELNLAYSDDEDKKNSDPDVQAKRMEEAEQKSRLPSRVNSLIKLLFDVKIMQSTMKSIGYDVDKMPLGKLSKTDIENGYSILKDISEELLKPKPKRALVIELTNMFYTQIPHDFGFSNFRDQVINDDDMLKVKLDLLDALSNMKITNKSISNSNDSQSQNMNVIEQHYDSLNNKITPLSKGSDTWNILENYIQKGNLSSHNFKVEVVDIFELDREGEAQNYQEDMGNKMLLWHGSRLTNFVGILSQGLRIAPPEAPVTGYMFGKGVYFADFFSKSAQYCHSYLSNNNGLLALCEVALGETQDLLHANYNAGTLPEGKNSTKGCGSFSPAENRIQDLDGVKVPIGPGKKSGIKGSLRYNEYIVYDLSQVKLKYLVHCNFA